MVERNKRRLTLTTVIFWILLLYIIAALVWWFFLLRQQTAAIYNLQAEQVRSTYTDTTAPAYRNALASIADQKRRNDIKYIGEGVIFLLLIIIGAAYIYRSVRRQLGLQQQQQNFVMAVTHELKTPISVARLNLETLKRYQQLDAQKQQKLIDTSLQETLRLDMLINNILISSQLDGKAYQPSIEAVAFSDLLKSEIKGFSNRYPDRIIHVDIEDNIVLNGDELLLKLLVSNLLENANKYSGKDTPIYCSLATEESEPTLTVADEGIGISPTEKENIFEKFYRIGNEQTRTTKGTGLGLYICKKIAETHNATIQVMDNIPVGSKFIVQFVA